jgi:TfoX/Sxy family transcriptional regulator of competence genes
VAYDKELADRIRKSLAGQQVREVSMFGGLAFMVNEKMAVSANGSGDLLVRVDPAQVEELEAKGAETAEMGRGRQMSKGWLRVRSDHVQSDKDLDHWVGVALDFNRAATGGKAGGKG